MDDTQLSSARKTIDDADREMARLFERRMEAVRQIGEYKRAHGLPVTDPAREEAVIRQNLPLIADPQLRPDYERFLRSVMSVSRRFQHRLSEGIRIAYSGAEGAFAQIAAARIFPDGQYIPCPDFGSAYREAENGSCDVCVLPVENSYAGEVAQVTDLIFTGSLHVTGIYQLPVTHCLLGLEGVSPDGIRRVISHPQALAQCAPYLSRHGYETVEASNTAQAARLVRDGGDPSAAAIASPEAAALYGLSILDYGINESSLNTTRFAVLSRTGNSAAPAEGGRFLIFFTVGNTAGALAGAISVIGRHGFNMLSLRSRPMKSLPWQYYFVAEIEGTDLDSRGSVMLSELSSRCSSMKVAGRYASEQPLKGDDAL